MRNDNHPLGQGAHGKALQGSRAYDTGGALNDNPYKKDPDSAYYWQRGFLDGARTVVDGWKLIRVKNAAPRK